MEVKFVGSGLFIGGLEAIYKVKKTQKLEKFMRSFGKVVGFPWENLRFMMVPEMVWYDTILQELGITDSEIEIDVFHGQPYDFSHLFMSGLYSDTVIKVEGQTIKCHMPLLTPGRQQIINTITKLGPAIEASLGWGTVQNNIKFHIGEIHNPDFNVYI